MSMIRHCRVESAARMLDRSTKYVGRCPERAQAFVAPVVACGLWLTFWFYLNDEEQVLMGTLIDRVLAS